MRFKTVMLDPPWNYDTWTINGRKKNPDRHYSTMSIDDIAGLPISELAEENAAVLLWCTWPKLTEGMHCLKEWGFEYRTGFPWIKMHRDGAPRRGTGYHIASCSEPLLIATRGVGVCPPQGGDNIGVLFHPQGRHSAKPEDQYRLAERYPGPHISVFDRRYKEGWVCLGNELDGLDITDAIKRVINDEPLPVLQREQLSLIA